MDNVFGNIGTGMENIANKINNFEAPPVNWNKNVLQKFMAVIILGYFGVKIFYGIFLKYSQKPLDSEIPDFMTLIVLSSIIYLFTNIGNRWLLGRGTSINWLFFMGYLFGLNLPFVRDILGQESIMQNTFLQIFILFIVIFIILVLLWANVKNGSLGYIIYILAILIIILGLLLTRKQSSLVTTTTISDENSGKVIEEGLMKTPGTYVSFGMGMLGFLLSLIFVHQNEEFFFMNLVSFFNGITLGLFVGAVSYDGIQYILSNTPAKKVQKNNCTTYNLMLTGDQYKNLSSNISTMGWVISLLIMMLMVIIILMYVGR